MEIESKQLRRCDLIVATGRIDTATVGVLTEALEAITAAGRYRIVLNLKAVTYISSTGLGQLINTQKACKRLHRGELILAEVPPRINQVLELAGLSDLFKVFETETEAVGSF